MFLEISDKWLYWGAFVPAYVLNPLQLYRVLTSMFFHSNLFHIFFNMLYLYFFGRSVESVLGGRRYLALYLLSGLLADVFHVAFIPVEGPATWIIPAVGASGAISGVLGAYLLLFPGSRLTMCFFYLFFPICVTLNAAAYLVLWFATQVVEGFMGTSLGVAVFAHAGGFVGGLALLPRVLNRQRHSLFRMLTAARREFKYVYFGSAGLGVFSKMVLILLLLGLAASGIYSMAGSQENYVPFKVLDFRVEYRVYCYPVGALCDYGAEEELVTVGLERDGARLLGDIASSSVRVVYNRLAAAGLIYDKSYADVNLDFNKKVTGSILGIKVDTNFSLRLSYDEDGVIESGHGSINTNIVSCTGNRCASTGWGEYTVSIETVYKERQGYGQVAVLTVLGLASTVTCLMAVDSVVRKARLLEIVA